MSKKAPTNSYDSNPFSLTFNSLGKLFEHNPAWAFVLVGITVVGLFARFVLNIVGSLLSSPSSATPATSASATPDVGVTVLLGLIILGFFAIGIVVFAVISTYLSAIYSYVALKSIENKSVSASEAFARATKRFWPLFWSQLLAGIKIIGWLCVFIVPGIVAAYRYALLPTVVLDSEEKSVKKLHDRTKVLVKTRLWEVFGVQFVAAIVPFIGNLVGYSGRAALYRQLQVSSDTNTDKPAVHWLNYLGLFILAGILVFMLCIAIVILLIVVASK